MPDDLPIAEQADLYSRFSQAGAAIERNVECSRAAERARELYLEAGRPIDAAEMLTLISVDAIRSGRPTEEYGAVDDPGDRRGGGGPPSPERDRTMAFLRSGHANRAAV